MFIVDTLKTKLVSFRHKSGRSTPTRSTVDIKPVAEPNSQTFGNATSLPLSSKARKPRLFSSLTHIKRKSLSNVFKKDPAIQIPSTMSPRTISATLESSGDIPDVLEDGSFPIVPSRTEHRECSSEFGLISKSSTINESPTREDSYSLLDLHPPGSRTSIRVASLRMRTAAVWASIPATMDMDMDGVPASCEYSEASTSQTRMNSPERDETTSIDRATVYGPSFSSPATSVTAVSDWGMGHKQEPTYRTPKATLDGMSLTQPPDSAFPGLVAERPPERRRITEETQYNSSNSPAYGCGSFPDILSISSDQYANPRAGAGPLDSHHRSPDIPHAVCPTATKQPFSPLPVVHLFTNSDKDNTTSSIRGSLTLFQRPLATESPLRPWSCAKITRAKTKRASRRERDLLTRMSHILEASP